MAIRRLRPLTRKQKERYFRERYAKLLDEGYAPEEADMLANIRISRGEFAKLRRKRKKMVLDLLSQGWTPKSARRKVREDLRSKKELLIDWDSFRNLVYPKKGKTSLAG